MRSRTFLYKIQFPTTFMNVFCCFTTLYLNHINLSSPLAPLMGGEIDICAHGYFYMKFNSQQLLSEAFFHGMCLFGVSVLCAYWHIYNTVYVDCNDITIRCPMRISPTCLPIHLVYVCMYVRTAYYVPSHSMLRWEHTRSRGNDRQSKGASVRVVLNCKLRQLPQAACAVHQSDTEVSQQKNVLQFVLVISGESVHF